MKVVQSELKRSSSTFINLYLSPNDPFSVHTSQGVMCAANEACVLVTFSPMETSDQQGLLIFVCETGEELVCELNGEGYETAVALSKSSITLPDTLMGTHSFASFSIQNDSDETVNFKWNLQEYYGVLLLQPPNGILLPKSLRDFIVTFSPDSEKEFVATALCTVSGRKEPLDLLLCGHGRGPEIEFSFTSLNVGKVLVTTTQAFELVLHNRSEIKASFFAHLKYENCRVAPQKGVITADGYQVVMVTLWSTSLGPFTRNIDFEVLGSSRMKSITISGEFVPPELLVEPSLVDFRKVAFGFEMTKMMKVQNVSAIPISITFNVGAKSLSVSPSQALLEKMDTVVAEITYFASEVGSTDSCIRINMETVGKIFEIPITGRCCVPQIQAECRQIELDSCFFNHPREFTVPLVNPSDLLAKYHILPVENTSVQITSTSLEGLLPPEKVTHVPLQVYAKVTGFVSVNLEVAIVGADYNPLVVEVVCHCVGPVLSINAEKVDFGRIAALTPFQHSVLLSNESPIPAHLTSIKVQKSTTFCVHPQEVTIPPFGRTQVEVTACADDVDVEIAGVLEICVENSEVSPHIIQLRAIGVGNTITIEPEVPLRLSLGQQFESLPQTRAFVVKNCGRRQQRLVWTVENVHCIRKVDSNKKPKEPDYEIQLDPPKFELKPFQGADFSLKVTSVSPLCLPPIAYTHKGEEILSNAASLLYTRSMEIRFTLKCHTVIGNAGHKRLLQECIVSAVFIKPMIEVVPNPVEFCLLKIPEKDVENAHQSIVITNLAEIETALQVAVDKPCFLNECARPAQSLELTLSGKGEENFCVGFAPPLANNKRTSFVVDTHLNVSFLKHPLKLTIPVHGEVHFPSLRVENDFLDFGSVENGSEVTKSLLLLNTSPIKVNYRWKLVHGSLRNSQREPLRLLMRSKSQELRTIPATPLVHSSSISNIDALHITDVFSITPGSGSVPAGESVSTCIKFHAHSDVAASCAAICCVSDGPDYTVDLKGESSTSDCYIKTNEVPFREILFNEEAIESFHIYNAGKVPSPFYFTWDRNDVNFRMFPTKGEVPGKGVAEIKMCVDVPQPREFTVFAKVHLAGKQPEQIRVHGKACFPHVVLNLPRINGEPPRDSDLCKDERDFINSQLATDHPSHILTLSPYKLDFCDIVWGEVKERKLTLKQLCHSFAYHLSIKAMNRKMLAKKGVTVQIGCEISITFDSSNSETGQIALEIPLKIHRHVVLPIQLVANVVASELKMSDSLLDFGEIYVDEAKILAVQLHNPTPFPINWSESRPKTAISSFELMPKSGSLQSDQKENVFIKYKPRIGGPVSENIRLLLTESKTHLEITCQGVGLEPRLIVQPRAIEFRPLIPNGETDEQAVIIKNPCPFPVEFYSLDFDEIQTKEERCLTFLPLFDEAEEVLLPPRKPGKSLPVEAYEHELQPKPSRASTPKTSYLRSSKRGTAKQTPEHFRKMPPNLSPFNSQTTFRRYAEERRTGVEEAGIVLLVFGSPQSGQSDLAKLLAQHYDAVHLNLNEFFANLEFTSLKNSEKDALSAPLLSADSIFGLIMSGIGNSKRCETVLKALGKRRMNMFAVTVTREIASISLADARYEEALSKAEKYAFERKVTEYRSMEEWQYDILPDSARQEVDLALAEWKRQQHKESKQVVMRSPMRSSLRKNLGSKSSISSVSSQKGKYADLEVKLKEFEKEHRRICHLLSTWDIKNQEQNPNEASLPLIDLDAPKNGSSRNSDDNLVGIPHFVVHSKLDVEIMESPVDQVYERVEDVQRERPNISVVLNKLLPHLPTREEIRRQLGYGPLAIEIPPPITFSVVHRPVKRERCGEVDHYFTIVKPPGLAEATEAGLLDMPKATEGLQSVSGVSTMTPRSRRTSTSSSSRGKRWQGKASLAIPEQNFCDPSIYRWIVPENGQIQLPLRFTPRGVGNFRELLRFEILRTKEEIIVECQGCCQLPRLVTEPRKVFSKIEEFYPLNKPPRKTFIIEKDCFEFGPLLAAKSRDLILAGEYKENVTELRLQNDGPHGVEVKLAFENNEGGENFAVSPSELHISRNEVQVAKVYALPTAAVTATSKLIGQIKDNPKPIKFNFAVIGVLPSLTVQTKVVNFGKIPLNKAELQQVVIFNPTPIPVAWKCEILVSMKETDFNVCPSSGILKSPNEIFNLTVEYSGSSDPRRIAIKRWLRFYAMDTRGLSSPVTIHPSVGVQLEVVDPGFEIAMPKEGLGFGLVRVREETKKTLELRNHGPFKLQYKFHAVLSERKQMDLQKALTINPQSGILLPSQNLNITVCCYSLHEVEIHNEAAFICEVETHKGVPISTTPIPISVRIRRSHFKILPSKEVAFGTMVVNTRATEQVTIKNDGHFDLHYSILPKHSTFKARSAKRESSQKRPLGARGREKISQGPFVISPASGTIAIGQKQPITVQCSSGPIKAIFDEELVIQIADKPNGETDVASVPFRLSMEVCSPSLGIEDMASIFEEHLVCQSRNELESLANHGIIGAAYIGDENCFDFGATLIGTVSCGRFRLFNNSKAALDAKFLLRQEKTEKRRRTRRNESDALEAFNVVPAISRIEPYQSVYVACSFTAKSLGVYSTTFQVLVEEESAPLLKFDLRGKGEIPRVSVEEPTSQNPRGNRYLVFNKDQTSRFIRIRNDGVIPCQVKVDVETTESHVAAFRLGNSEFRREVALVSDCLQTSVNFTLAASESHSLEVAFIPENHKNGGRITGCVKIFLQGNNYEKEVIELCGVASAELTSAPQIHLVDPVLDPLDFEKVNNKNHMSLGNCYVGAPILKHLLQSYPIKTDEPGLTTRLENKLPSFIFAWPRDHPHLEFEPATGDLHPGSSLTVFVKFYSDRPVAYHLAPVRCELIQVLKAEPQMDYSTLTEGMAVDKDQRCSARSAGTPRSRVRGSPKLQRKSLSARSNYSQKICLEESAKLDVVNDKTEDEGKRERKFLDLYFTIDCGFVEYLCEVDSIEFVATPLYCEAVKTLQIKNTGRVTMTFRIEKVDNDDESFEVDISESLILPGKSAELRLTFRPTRSGEHQCSFTLRVPSTAEESTASKAIRAIGRGVSVPIHLQLSKCDYEARQLPADPLWYQAQTLVIVATGTGHKVTRSFEIMNASEDSIELDVQKVDTSDRTMDVVLSETFIKSGHSTNVEVSFLSPTRETKEVCVIFEASGHRVPLLLVGQTREAVVAFDRSHLRLPELPIGRKVEEVEHRQIPLRLNVKTGALKCSTTVWLLDDCSEAKQAIPAFLMQCPAKDVTKSITSASRRVVDFPSLRKDLTVVDFGEVFTGCDSTRLIKLVNHGDYEVEFGTVVTSTSKNVLVPFSMTPGFGKVGQLKETLLQIVFKPDSAFRASTQTTNFLGVIAILNGPAFAFDLRGRVTVNAVDISPSQLNFGAQFTQETGLGVITKCLRISNRSPDKPVYVAVVASTLPEFICDFSPQMLEPSSTADAKVTFYPSACKSYESKLCFLVNEKVKIKVPARGRGVKLDVEINCGSLMINQEREGMSKAPVKLRDGKQVESSVVHLGNLNFMQSSRRTVAIMNKSPSPITITGASVLPKSKALNKVRVNASTSRPNPSDILSLTFLPSPLFASSNRTPDREYRGSPEDNCLSQPRKDATAQIEVFFSPRDLPIMSFCEEILLQISTTTNPDKCIWIPGFTICGKCTGAKMVSETSAINFGTVVVGSSCCKTVAISNRGNKSATFVWDEKTLPRHVVSVEPKSGRIRANTSMNFKFTLKPVRVNQELCFENVTCNIEGSKPLRFAITGLCTASHEVAEVIHFACAVREKDTQSVSLSNPTNSVWTVKPVFTGTEWSGKGLFEILPKGSVDYAITYHPLNMTSNDDVHKGSIFFPFPNGTGLKCHLEGTSNPPDALKPKTLVEIPCRRKYGLQIDVPNWLSRLQRFHVSWIASNGSNFTFAGPQFIDVPGGVSKKYPLTCEGLSEASTTLKITFSSTETKEYQFVEYQIRAIRPKPEGLIKLKTPLRKPVTYQLGLENPLRRDTVVALHSTLPELMCPPEYKLTAQSNSTINLDFIPWRIGKFSGSLEVNSSDLGLSVYDLNLEALEPLPEKPVKFQTSLGQSDTVTVTISNLSRSRAEFTSKINNAAFRCERSVLVATNSSVKLPVTFEPNSLGTLEATLKVTSSQAGSFIFPLHGFAKLPTPQGPFLVSTTAPTSLTVKNVFSEPIEFTLEVDNTAFRVEYAPKVVSPHKELKILVTLEPRDSSLNVHGKLVVSCNPSTLDLRIQWVFYLKGITAA
ncbi:Hydrocephalus-inducing -like protein [Echinococcus granulosus]|nr:Hydrocephalus-inducing -like protein [Echinococcus granulosus]